VSTADTLTQLIADMHNAAILLSSCQPSTSAFYVVVASIELLAKLHFSRNDLDVILLSPTYYCIKKVSVFVFLSYVPPRTLSRSRKIDDMIKEDVAIPNSAFCCVIVQQQLFSCRP